MVRERVIGTIRREFLDWLITVSELPLRTIRRSALCITKGCPHRILGPGVPDPPTGLFAFPEAEFRDRLPTGTLVFAKAILGGLYHEYSFGTAMASA